MYGISELLEHGGENIAAKEEEEDGMEITEEVSNKVKHSIVAKIVIF